MTRDEERLAEKLRFIPKDDADAADRCIDALIENLTDAEIELVMDAPRKIAERDASRTS